MAKNTHKQIITSLLTALLLLMALSISFVGFAANESGSCGSGLTWAYNDATKTLTINGNGAMNDYNYHTNPWWTHGWEITKIVFEEGITKIGAYAFYECTAFTKVEIPSSVEIIGEAAFASCTSLVSVDLKNGLKSIGNAAFQSCTVLNRIEIPDSVQSIGTYAFSSCYALTKAIIGNGVQSISQNAFYYCSNLTDVSFGKSVVSIGSYAFCSCPLTDIVLGESTETIGTYAFSYCNLNTVTLPRTLESVGVGAFSSQSNSSREITHVYYYGTEADWNKVIVGNENEPLLSAQWHYIDPTPHTHSYTSAVTKAATCNATGIRTFTCSCGDSYTEEIAIDANNHAAPDNNGNCTRCGKHIKDVEPTTQKPTDSEHEKQEEKLNFFERLIKWIRDFFARLFGR